MHDLDLDYATSYERMLLLAAVNASSRISDILSGIMHKR